MRSLLSIYDVDDLTALDVPWWTFASADLVERFLSQREAAKAFEWGSGASTVWLSRRGARVTSVEHDAEWASSVIRLLPEGATAEIRTVPALPASARVGELRSRKKGYEDLDFQDYVRAIDSAQGPFDLIIVDGRSREHCLIHAIPHLKADGILVFDDVERKRYQQAIAAVATAMEITVTRGFGPCLPYPTQTAILRRR